LGSCPRPAQAVFRDFLSPPQFRKPFSGNATLFPWTWGASMPFLASNALFRADAKTPKTKILPAIRLR
jgi:hypothetical protein